MTLHEHAIGIRFSSKLASDLRATVTVTLLLPNSKLHSMTTLTHPIPSLADHQSTPLQSYGRGLEKFATCPTVLSANSGCGISSSALAVAPGPNTKWTFEPAPGSNSSWFIRMSVSRGSPQLPVRCSCLLPGLHCTRLHRTGLRCTRAPRRPSRP